MRGEQARAPEDIDRRLNRGISYFIVAYYNR